MNTVSAALSRKKLSPVTVAPDTAVLEALEIMAEKNIGSLLVM